MFGLCPYPAVRHYTFPLAKQTRNVTIPWSGRRPPLKFVHVSDVHIDQYYQVGLNRFKSSKVFRSSRIHRLDQKLDATESCAVEVQ